MSTNREASPGLKKGGAVNLVLHAVEVMAPADAIPEAITVDLTGLDFADSVHVSDLKLPEGCKPVASKTDLTVVTIVPPTVMAEEAAATAAAPAAPPAAAPAAAAAAPAKGAAKAAGQGRRSGQGRSRGRRGEEVSLANPPPSAAEGSAFAPAARARRAPVDRGPHAGHRRTRQSRRAPRPQPSQHRLHGDRGDRGRASHRAVPLALLRACGGRRDRPRSASCCSRRRPS